MAMLMLILKTQFILKSHVFGHGLVTSCPVLSPEHVVGDEPGEDEEAEHVALLHAHQPEHDHEKYLCGQKILRQLHEESINR